MTSELTQPLKTTCKVCQCEGCDYRFLGCGCTLHVRCLPPSVIRCATHPNMSTANDKKEQQGICQNFSCPFCHDNVSGIYLFPLPLEYLERAIKLKSAPPTSHQVSAGGKRNNHQRDGENVDEVTFSVYSKWLTGARGILDDSEQHRIGRWTDSEMAFVDQIVTIFDEGMLPIAEGVKLNTLLCDLLQCKSSRLTKKMKNAKLSTRSFKAAQGIPGVVNREDHQILSALQDKFLCGRPTEAAQLELRFNIIKQWRSYFSNFCMQAGYLFLDSKDWISSIEDLEERATAVGEKFRKVRRRSMSKALTSKKDNIKPNIAAKQSRPSQLPRSSPTPKVQSSLTPSLMSVFDGVEETESACRRPRSFSEDFDTVLEDLASGESDDMMELPLPEISAQNSQAARDVNTLSYPTTFLDALRLLLETKNSPYQHADIWVPSFVNDGGEKIKLLHAGFVSRRDLVSMDGFGEYSKGFTFKPGQDLPGRVYITGDILWERRLQNLDARQFGRVSGAIKHGLRTATGIPLNTQGVGRMVVVFYSCNEMAEDSFMANAIARELTKYSPQPKWKLVIDINQDIQPQPYSSKEANKHVAFHPVTKANETTGIVSPTISSQTDPPRPSSPLESTKERLDSIENNIISILGEEVESFQTKSRADIVSPKDTDKLIPHYMVIRLLFLRPASRRSSQENEIIELLKCSYQSYVKGKFRSTAELARLLVRDWICLKSGSFSFGKPSIKCNEFKGCNSLLMRSDRPKRLLTMQPKFQTLYKPPVTQSIGSSKFGSRSASMGQSPKSTVLHGCN